MKSAEIRESFLAYFEKQGHRRVPSSPLIPHDDPTLLFINAGMNQFKDVFLGQRQVPYKRATSSQKCLRAGGKHNDLENVGQTIRHHTFFEMLGNFSFGDYFKEKAIYYCWDYVRNVLRLSPERFIATVYTEDDEAFAIWEKVAPELKNGRILRFGEKDNFWSMGETGPCGPSSELHYDLGERFGSEDVQTGVNSESSERYIEIWNLVFMQYNRDSEGKLTPLPKPSVDTGAGLERIAMVMQQVESNYGTDLFTPLIKSIEDLTGREYHKDQRGMSHRVIADHIRALSFTIADGAIPSNDGRGYVLRRILRRAARHGRLLGAEEPFVYKLNSALVDLMGEAFPEIRTQADHVALVIKSEEESFDQTLDQGIEYFEKTAEKAEAVGRTEILGKEVFKLSDTYGVPPDLTEVMARERGMTVDMQGFESELRYQRERSKSSASFSPLSAEDYPPSEFIGYDDKFEAESEVIVNRIYDGKETARVEAVLDQTPFYGESGGQVGDKGKLIIEGSEFHVMNTWRVGDTIVHIVREQVDGELSLKMKRVKAKAIVDGKRQKHIQRNHTATHLLHRALRDVLGEHIQQAGSLVAPDRLRFDFSHFKQVTDGELKDIERAVNEQILLDRKVSWRDDLTLDEAKAQGAVALFGEKYGDKVRMVTVEDYSKELCGGTHVQSTGEIGLFVIVSESAIAAGMRRIEAMTGEGALKYLNERREKFEHVMQSLKSAPEKVAERVTELLERNKQLEKELDKLKAQSATSNIAELFVNAEMIDDVKVVIHKFESRDQLNAYADYNRELNEIAYGIWYSDTNQYAVTASDVAIKNGPSARDIINHLNKKFAGRGGGREYFTQGGTQSQLSKDLLADTVLPFIKEKVGA